MPYKALSQFMGGWFHQDFNLERNSVAEVVAAFRAVTPAGAQRALKRDIQRFLDEHPYELERAFEALIKPEIIASALSGSLQALLEEIRDLLDLGVG